VGRFKVKNSGKPGKRAYSWRGGEGGIRDLQPAPVLIIHLLNQDIAALRRHDPVLTDGGRGCMRMIGRGVAGDEFDRDLSAAAGLAEFVQNKFAERMFACGVLLRWKGNHLAVADTQMNLFGHESPENEIPVIMRDLN
jgi:hypothetical protein